MSLWGRIFAAAYDRALAASEEAGLAERRRKLLADATGSVVEVGAGTGLNLEHYGTGATELVLVEPEEPMAKRLDHKLADMDKAARVIRAPAERLPFPDASFDTAVCTLVLCTVDDPDKALTELRRVLKPGSRLLFLEHVRADDEHDARWQDRLHPLWVRFGHGCHCNRDTLSAIIAAGFAVEDVDHDRLPKALKIVRPLIVGTAATPS